jgi:hypothetical protein
MAFLVLSSLVGPNPPVVMIKSPVSNADAKVFLMVSISSEIVKICETFIPIFLS